VEDLEGAPMSFLRGYRGRRVLVTGHTGFKGSWLTLWLSRLGAEVTGLSLDTQDPSLFAMLDLGNDCQHRLGDVRDPHAVADALAASEASLVIHLAAQSLVRRGHREPAETFETNVMGTVRVLDAVRARGAPCAVVVATSDKCYARLEGPFAYREGDAMGGDDPYAASKGAAELVVQAYRESYFPVSTLASHGVALASARAGNVIGGGDFAEDRIVPDYVRARREGRALLLRHPQAVRPWQHVLDPLGGYLQLGAALLGEGQCPREVAASGWNFGPLPTSAKTVETLVRALSDALGGEGWRTEGGVAGPKEAHALRLAIDKAVGVLGWAPRWGFDETLGRTATWYGAWLREEAPRALRSLCAAQIDDWTAALPTEDNA